jgi:F-type H+-transporting ATPase subunit epsilon
MQLKVLLPGETVVDEPAHKVIAEAENGTFCLKPRHVDVVMALVPGLLSFVGENDEEHFLAVDEGTLLKCGPEVLVSVRDAVRGGRLDALQKIVKERYLKLDEAERVARSALARLEAGFVRRYVEHRDELK